LGTGYPYALLPPYIIVDIDYESVNGHRVRERRWILPRHIGLSRQATADLEYIGCSERGLKESSLLVLSCLVFPVTLRISSNYRTSAAHTVSLLSDPVS
jgi:hypothetical protein